MPGESNLHAAASWRSQVVGALIGAFLSSGVVTAVGEFLSARRNERVVQEVRAAFERQYQVNEWKRQSLASLLGPVVMQLDRTRRAFDRYTAHNTFLESEILYKGNVAVRDLLLTNGHLIPDDLRGVSGQLIEHYDRWLEEYERVRGEGRHAPDEPFVFAGPQGYPFPSDADARFKECFRRFWGELYGP